MSFFNVSDSTAHIEVFSTRAILRKVWAAFYASFTPRQQFDHGTTVFDCRPCLTMVGNGRQWCDRGV